MVVLSNIQLNDIAQELMCGFMCYVNIHTGETKTFIDPEDYHLVENKVLDKEMIELDQLNLATWVKVRRMDFYQSLNLMTEFTKEVTFGGMKEELLHALSSANPQRSFKRILRQSERYQERWFGYRAKRYEDYVQVAFEKAVTVY